MQTNIYGLFSGPISFTSFADIFISTYSRTHHITNVQTLCWWYAVYGIETCGHKPYARGVYQCPSKSTLYVRKGSRPRLTVRWCVHETSAERVCVIIIPQKRLIELTIHSVPQLYAITNKEEPNLLYSWQSKKCMCGRQSKKNFVPWEASACSGGFINETGKHEGEKK